MEKKYKINITEEEAKSLLGLAVTGLRRLHPIAHDYHSLSKKEKEKYSLTEIAYMAQVDIDAFYIDKKEARLRLNLLKKVIFALVPESKVPHFELVETYRRRHENQQD
jgi:RNase adaptor protein for sRNA GlmZ degradation